MNARTSPSAASGTAGSAEGIALRDILAAPLVEVDRQAPDRGPQFARLFVFDGNDGIERTHGGALSRRPAARDDQQELGQPAFPTRPTPDNLE